MAIENHTHEMITENITIQQKYSWIDVERPLPADYESLQTYFSLPPLLAQDSMRSQHLPKYENSERGSFFILRPYDPSAREKDITIQCLTNQLAIFATKERVITIHPESLYYLRKYADLKTEDNFPKSIQGLVHQLFMIVIKSYEEALRRLQLLYEALEQDILSRLDDSLSNEQVYHFRRQLYVLKGLLQMTLNTLHASRSFWYTSSSLQQDLKENIDQIYFRLDDLGHNFDQLFSLHISISDQKNNEVMRVLTIFASIMLPLTFIASFYGMNFKHLPGLHSTSGMIGVLLFMISITFSTVWYFNKKRWFKLM